MSMKNYAKCIRLTSQIILFEETELFHTVDGTFRIPKQYAELLTLVYKDYMNIPDLDTRIREVMTHFNYLKFMENA